MVNSNISKSDEIDRNLVKFLAVLPALVQEHENEWVLMRDRAIIGFYGSAIDAQIAGNKMFDDQIFSIQLVKEEAEELRYFSYAFNSRSSSRINLGL